MLFIMFIFIYYVYSNLTVGGPRISETVRDRKNGFHIRNLRGRISLNRISERNKKIIFFGCMVNLYRSKLTHLLPYSGEVRGRNLGKLWFLVEGSPIYYIHLLKLCYYQCLGQMLI